MICSAKTTTGKPCRRYAVAGGTVCPTHGGSAPQVRQRAHQRLAEARARRLLDREGVEPVTDAVAALQQVAGEAWTLQQVLRQRVAELSDPEWVSRTRLGQEQASAWLSAYERALDRTGRLLTDLAKLTAPPVTEPRVERVVVEFVGVDDWADYLRGGVEVGYADPPRLELGEGG